MLIALGCTDILAQPSVSVKPDFAFALLPPYQYQAGTRLLVAHLRA
jgi:hypothetical protein